MAFSSIHFGSQHSMSNVPYNDKHSCIPKFHHICKVLVEQVFATRKENKKLREFGVVAHVQLCHRTWLTNQTLSILRLVPFILDLLKLKEIRFGIYCIYFTVNNAG